jgi:hypothetical protein
MSRIDIPGSAAPNNLHFADDVKATIIEGDLYDICTRLQEIDPTLFIILLEDGNSHRYTIMEHCVDGWDRLVWSVNELDQRILNKAAYLKSVPFEHRFMEAEKLEAKMKTEQEAEAFEEFYEKLGGPMRNQLRHDGFTDGNFTDYAKRQGKRR